MTGNIQILAVAILPFIFAVTVHEAAHGWVAKRLGDPTAMMMGRLTLNPIKHIDIIGTVILPTLLWITTGFVFGWAKPVPITYENLKRPKRDMGLVAIAGPCANLIMVILWAILLKITLLVSTGGGYFSTPIIYMSVAGIIINSVFMILNLLPLLPLDGGRVLSSLLPGPLSWKLSRLEPYGLPILLVLLLTGVLAKLIIPPIEYFTQAIEFLFGFYPLISKILNF